MLLFLYFSYYLSHFSAFLIKSAVYFTTLVFTTLENIKRFIIHEGCKNVFNFKCLIIKFLKWQHPSLPLVSSKTLGNCTSHCVVPILNASQSSTPSEETIYCNSVNTTCELMRAHASSCKLMQAHASSEACREILKVELIESYWELLGSLENSF